MQRVWMVLAKEVETNGEWTFNWLCYPIDACER